MPEPLRPPIPATCAHRPTVSGLVIPWINVQLADGGVDFRAQHNSRAQTCWREGTCQICNRPLTTPVVFLGGPEQLAKLQFDEPPLHPECAVYTTHACPMVAGRLHHFADRDPVSNGQRGKTCSEPGCDCGGWAPTPGTREPAPGRPAHDWYAVYASQYGCGVTRDNPDQIAVGFLQANWVLAIRHVSTPGVGRTWKRTTLDEVTAGG